MFFAPCAAIISFTPEPRCRLNVAKLCQAVIGTTHLVDLGVLSTATTNKTQNSNEMGNKKKYKDDRPDKIIYICVY